MVTILWLLACVGDDVSKSDPPVDDSDPSPDTDVSGETDTLEPPEPPECADGARVFIGTAPYADLQAALDAAVDGDVVEICPGIWRGRSTVRDLEELTVVGRTGDAADVVLAAPSYGTVLTVDGVAPRWTLRHLTFTQEAGTVRTTAVRVFGDFTAPTGSLVVEGCRFVDFAALREGPVLEANGLADVTLRDTVFSGVYAGNSTPVILHPVDRSVVVERCTFEDNWGVTHAALQIGRMSWSQTAMSIRVSDTVFARNTPMDNANGTALHVSLEAPGPTTVEVLGSSFVDNLQVPRSGFFPDEGGALYVGSVIRSGVVTVRVEDSVFDNNMASPANHIRLLRHGMGDPWFVEIARTRVWRGQSGIEDILTEGCDENQHAGIWATAAGAELTVSLEDVDVGSGPTASECGPVCLCMEPLEGVISGEIRPLAGDLCP